MTCTKRLLIVTLLYTCFITHTLSAFNFNIKELILGKSGCASYGTELCAEWYQEKTREFLTYFGVKNVCDIQIYRLSLTTNPEMKLIPGIAMRDGIWLNEDLMNTFSNDNRLWFIAHETAHFACNHAMAKIFVLNMQKISKILSSCVYGAGFAWALQHQDQLKKHPLLAGSVFGTYLSFISAKEYVSNINIFLAISKELEKQADLQAASMLCSHGLESVVLARIETLKDQVSKGFFIINSLDHPSLEDNLAYLQEFWNVWTQQKTQNA